MGISTYTGLALASVGTAGLIFSGNDALARVYKYVTNKDLLDNEIGTERRRSNIIKISVAILSMPVFVSGVISGIYDDASKIQVVLAYVFPSLAPVVPPAPAPAPVPHIDPCEDIQSLERAEDSGYDSLVIFFRSCPLVNSRTEPVVSKGAELFNMLAKDWAQSGQFKLSDDATRRGMALSEALMTYTMAHSDVQLGTRLVKGDPSATILISPWPDPQGSTVYRTVPNPGKPVPPPATSR